MFIFEKNNILQCKSEPGFLVRVSKSMGTIFEAEVVNFPKNPIKYKNNTRFNSPRLNVGDVRLFESHNFEFDLQVARNFILSQLF